MKAQEPRNFKDILELQKILDENIHNYRERKESDIRISLIAEIIEFNEETKDSHKTWKSKPYNREKELEELTDIFFFFAQLVNSKKSWSAEKSLYLDILDEFFNEKQIQEDTCTDSLIYVAIAESLTSFFTELMKIINKYGYTKDDILKTYWKKWKKNMDRIGKEWN